MPPRDQGLRDRANRAIADHIVVHGHGKWKLLTTQFPEVKERTFHDWIHAYIKGTGAPPRAKAAARKRTRQPDFDKHLPVIPPPHYAETAGAQVNVDMDFLARARLIESDIMAVRARTLFEEGEERAGDVRNLGMMLQTIDRRMDSLNIGLKIYERIYDLQFMREYLSAIVDIIKNRVSNPDEWRLIGEDVADLDAKYNMTPAAGA